MSIRLAISRCDIVHYTVFLYLIIVTYVCFSATPVVPAGLKNIAQNLHERFMARDEVVDILHSLKTIHSDKIKTEKAIERFTCTL